MDDDSAPTGPVHDTAAAGSLRARLKAVYAREIGDSERSLLLSWAAFAGTFAVTRAVTHLIRWRDGSSGGSGGLAWWATGICTTTTSGFCCSLPSARSPSTARKSTAATR